jgi:uncharacterized protein (TIGR03437 family)
MALLAAASLCGGVTFTDGTFNLSDYSITTFKSDPTVGITVQQTQTGGNPGQAVQILYSFPASSGNTMVGLARPSFTYNPATQGAIQSIDFSVDKYSTYTGCDSCFLTTHQARLLILQNGAYYIAVVNAPGTAGIYQKASATGLRASDFGLFDFKTGASNTAVNPSFSSGVMQFGLANRYMFQFDQPTSADIRLDNLTINVQSMAPPPPPPPVPAISAVITASGFGGFSSAAPGSWVEIYGSNLATSSRPWSGADFTGASAPTSLDGVQVSIGGQRAFVEYISTGQVNAQLPSNIATGGMLQITLTNANGSSAPYNINVNTAQPGLLAPASFKINGYQYAVALLPDGGTYILPPGSIPGVTSRPAKPGETIVLYGVGFGAVTPGINAGQIVTLSNQLSLPLQILFGQTPAQLSYYGLSPGFVGLYQFNVVAPAVADSDLVPLTFNLGGVAGGQTLYIAVRQ